MKICKKCNSLLYLECFHTSKVIKDGFENTCKECRKEARKKHKKTCACCHRKFLSQFKDAVYCSNSCLGKSKESKFEVDCSYCGNKVRKKRYKKDAHEYYYCNQTCRTQHLKRLMLGVGNPNYGRIQHNCDGCDKLIEVIPSKLAKQQYVFCSNDCYKENIGQYFSGSNNPFWNPMLTMEDRVKQRKYEEYYKWRFDVFERDSFTCQKCYDNKGGNLIAHHILNYSEHPDLRTEMDNGITLCEDCHKSFHDRYGYRNNNKGQLLEYITKTSAV